MSLLLVGISTKNPKITDSVLKNLAGWLRLRYSIVIFIVGDSNNECTIQIENPTWSKIEVHDEAIRLRETWIKNNLPIIQKVYENEPSGRYKIIYFSDVLKVHSENSSKIQAFINSKEFEPYSEKFLSALEKSAIQYIERLTNKVSLTEEEYKIALKNSIQNLQTEVIAILLHLYRESIPIFRYPTLGSLQDAFQILDSAIKAQKLLKEADQITVTFTDLPLSKPKKENKDIEKIKNLSKEQATEFLVDTCEDIYKRTIGYSDFLEKLKELDPKDFTEDQARLIASLYENFAKPLKALIDDISKRHPNKKKSLQSEPEFMKNNLESGNLLFDKEAELKEDKKENDKNKEFTS